MAVVVSVAGLIGLTVPHGAQGATPPPSSSSPPTVESLSPAVISTAGANLFVTGSGFVGPITVTLGTVPVAHVRLVSGSSIELYAPPHAAGAAELRVENRYGTSPSVADDNLRYAAGKTLDWQPPAVVDPVTGPPIGVSCPTSSFCASVDAHGNFLTYDGSTWQRQPAALQHNDLTGISCATTTFCVAVDFRGHALSWDGSRWSAPQRVDSARGSLIDVSCAAAGHCVAIDDQGKATTLNGTTWSVPTAIGASKMSLRSLSCPTTAFCVAVGAKGAAVTDSGGRWSAVRTIDPGHFLSSVSCSSADQCTAVASDGYAIRDSGGTWAAPVLLEGPIAPAQEPLMAVSCASAMWCQAVDAQGNAFVFDGAGWTKAVAFGTRTYSISCPSSSDCVSLGYYGDAYTYDGAGWSTLTPPDPVASGLGAVHCFTTTSCVAVDGGGATLTLANGRWSTPARLVPSIPEPLFVSGFACADPAFCMMTDGPDDFTYDGKAWSKSPRPGQPQNTYAFPSVACATASFCVDVFQNVASIYNGTTWSPYQQILRNALLFSVSCASTTSCLAVGSGGEVVRYRGTSWRPARTIAAKQTLNAVSCPSATFCAATGSTGSLGAALTEQDGHWTVTDFGPYEALSGVSCSSASFCLTTDSSGNAIIWDGAGWSPPAAISPDLEPADLENLDVDCPAVDDCVAVGGSHAIIGT